MAKRNTVTPGEPASPEVGVSTSKQLPAKFEPDAKYVITVHTMCKDGTFTIRPRGTYHVSGEFAESIRDNIATCERI